MDRLQTVCQPARKLFTVIANQAYHGPLRPKAAGTATPPEILEACGLDVGEFYTLLDILKEAGLIRVTNCYPFEEIQLSPDAVAGYLASEGTNEVEVTYSSFAVPPDQRFFEDYQPGSVYDLGTIAVTESEIIEFARQFDPQYFHIDPQKAVASRFGGIVASGWHTVCLAMRLFVDHYLSHVASLASPGVDDIRWPAPVRPGDVLNVRVTVLEARPSRSKPDRGIVRAKLEALNQSEELVLSLSAVSFLGCRPQS